MSSWGHLEERFGTEQPRKLLALDGGGIRGVLSLEILAEIERKIADKTGIKRLGDYFDYIGGTSTGAIIAAGLSIGMSAAELLNFIAKQASDVREKRVAQTVEELLHGRTAGGKVAGYLPRTGRPSGRPNERAATLPSPRRHPQHDDGFPWPISSNPFAKYNEFETQRLQSAYSSLATRPREHGAPVFFPPEILNWDPDDPGKSFVFVDGGLTPYNNPAFLLYRMATQPAYRLKWKTGEQKLLLVSVGTGAAAGVTDAVERNLFGNMQNLPSE